MRGLKCRVICTTGSLSTPATWRPKFTLRQKRAVVSSSLPEPVAAASEEPDSTVARAKLYMEAGADAIFPEALNTAEIFRAFAERMPAYRAQFMEILIGERFYPRRR